MPNNRARRRQLAKAKAQIVLGQRGLINPADYDDALASGELDEQQKYALLIDDVMTEVNGQLREIQVAGGDVLKHTVVVIGQNPAYPGQIMVQSQTDAHRPGFERGDDGALVRSDGVGETPDEADLGVNDG